MENYHCDVTDEREGAEKQRQRQNFRFTLRMYIYAYAYLYTRPSTSVDVHLSAIGPHDRVLRHTSVLRAVLLLNSLSLILHSRADLFLFCPPQFA